jgi:hypothetical protein
MRRTRGVLAVLLTACLMQDAYACSREDYVLARSPERVKERFDSVDTVLTARLVKARKAVVRDRASDVEIPAEIDTFVVTRVFKGRFNKGDQFVLTTLLAACGMSAVNDPPSVLQLGLANPRELMKDWLLYMNSNESTQIKNSEMTQPLGVVAVDLPILEKLSRQQ